MAFPLDHARDLPLQVAGLTRTICPSLTMSSYSVRMVFLYVVPELRRRVEIVDDGEPE
jgi:hypothetical protein